MQMLHDIKDAILRLSIDDRVDFDKWYYAHPFRSKEEDCRIAEPAPAYDLTRQPMSVEEYLEFQAVSAIKHEYVAGEIFAMAGASLRHNIVSRNLVNIFSRHLRGSPCRAFIADIAVRIKTHQHEFFYYPDVMVACEVGDIDRRTLDNPKLIVEVLSHSTERTDRWEKALNYRHLQSLEEYVLVAQSAPEATFLRRAQEWRPAQSSGFDSTVEFHSIGLRTPLAHIYEGAA